MGEFFDEIPESLLEWISKQHMFWVASAPLGANGHVNVSPKGTADCFHVVNSKQVWYEDLSGSGVETISHLRENGRITILLSAFEGPPRILRLFGVGTVHEYGTPEYNALIPAGARKPGSRAAIVIDIYQVGTSCGYAVPFYDFVRHRTQLLQAFEKVENGDRHVVLAADSGVSHCDTDTASINTNTNDLNLNRQNQTPDPDSYRHLIPSSQEEVYAFKGAPRPPSLRGYWFLKNSFSLDGLPGLSTAPDAILSMAPQSRIDMEKEDPRRTMGQNKGPSVDGARESAGFVSGFVLGAVAALAITRVFVMLQH